MLISIKIFFAFINFYQIKNIPWNILAIQIALIGPNSLSIILITSFFMGMVLSLQIVKELLYLNAVYLIGSVLTISFLRELSPVLTLVIFIGRVGSCFTSELATMKVTEQIDALYLLGTNPISYLVLPRIISCIVILPVLNLFAFTTSLFGSAFICLFLYNIDPSVFFLSSLSSLYLIDILKSSIKTIIFGFCIAIISCAWGLSTNGGSQEVGLCTTSSVVVSLLSVFMLDFILSYFMFNQFDPTLNII
uniref:ABC transporter permease n=1 Tax=Crouania attenuata TaxID=42002 RepID=A0A4D6WNN7_9FLOR|nr:hypothetical protein [Crouania attenuata]